MTQLTSRFGPWFSLMINIIHLGCLVPVIISDQEDPADVNWSVFLMAVNAADAISFSPDDCSRPWSLVGCCQGTSSLFK